MRTLTVTREKHFAGCLGTIKFYVEDANAPDIHIDGLPCRLLGKLKNGETASWAIGCGALRIFALADRASQSYCRDQYAIPAGEEDLTLCGRCHFNPANGNAFLFAGNTDKTALELRKKGSRRGWLVLLAAILVGFLLGIFVISPLLRGITPDSAKPMTFSAAGLQITLTEEFAPDPTMEGFTVCYLSPRVAVFALQEPFSLAEGFGELTAAEYGELVREALPHDTETASTEEDGLLYLTYEADVEGDRFFYFNTLHKTGNAFWQVCFAMPVQFADALRDEVVSWAKSIRFVD
ncbi:MAG: hypothetical protein IJZ02_00225 [Clostridia bacterium]|nr:hypothetical protein [Clostridia bacterium]